MAWEQGHPPVTWEYHHRSDATFGQPGWGAAKIDQWHASGQEEKSRDLGHRRIGGPQHPQSDKAMELKGMYFHSKKGQLEMHRI